MGDFKQFLLSETSLGRIYQHTKGRHIGMITASRGDVDDATNKSNNAHLGNDIRLAGFGYKHVVGHYTEDKGQPTERRVKEHSYMIFGNKGPDNGAMKGFLKKHGEKYGQDSVLYKPHDTENAHLIGTKQGGWPGKGKTHDLGKFHPNRAPEMHSALRNGKTFTFGENLEWEEFYLVEQKTFFQRRPTPVMIIGHITENIDYYAEIWSQ